MITKSPFFRRCLIATTCVFAMGASAFAQTLAPDVVASQLASAAAGPVVTALKSQDALVIDPTKQIPTAFDLPSVNIPVAFDGDSHILTADGMIALRNVAAALKDERLAGQGFQVAGHYVSEKDPNSAVRLSAKRAQTVAEHLSIYYEIPASKLIAVGYGAAALLDPNVVNAPTNTRIQFINLLSQ